MTPPLLIVGLGNPLMGDEGLGWHLIQALKNDPRRPEDAEIIFGGADLLALADSLEGRRAVILADAALNPDNPGRISVYDNDFSALRSDQEHAHHLSLVQSLELFRTLFPALKDVRFILVTVGVAEARLSDELSPPLRAALPKVVEEILRLAKKF